MKLFNRRKSIFLTVVFSISLLFTVLFFSCNTGANANEPNNNEHVNKTEKEYIDDYTLPTGAEGDIPAWTKSDNTYNLPELNLHGEASNITPELKAALADAVAKENFFKKPKNFIVMIGDGMGVSQILAATKFRGDLLMNELPYRAVANSFLRGVENMESEVTDSGAGGTKIATGYRTTKLFASMDGEGNELESLSELARSKGKMVGVVTNAELPDATPADFSVHSKNRSQGWNKICDMQVLFGADLFMGGSNSSLTDSIGSLKPLSGKKIKKYTKLSSIIPALDSEDLMWNIFSGGDKTYARWDSTSTKSPSLQQAMALSLTRLQKTSGDKGFFLMFENTYTDLYGHANDDFMKTTKVSSNVVGIVNEVKDFDEAVAIALKFVLENPDTVLLVTADHETGDMEFKKNWENYEITDNKVKTNSGSHSNQNVPIFAIGYGLESLDTKKGTAFTKTDCTLLNGTDGDVLDNAICGQIIGSLMNEAADSFGGDIESSTKGRARDTFTVKTKSQGQSFDFDINEETLPIYTNNLIQFKLKPYSEDAYITIIDSNGNKLVDAVQFSANKKAEIIADSKGNVSTPLSQAYRFAFDEDSGVMDGWYQFSISAAANTSKLKISITNSADGSGNAIEAGTQISLDDFTVQYGSTRGYVTLTGENIEIVADAE